MAHAPDQDGDISRRGRGTRDWAVWAEQCPALRARSVLAAGYTVLGPGYEILRRHPAFLHVGACVEGQVEYFADGHWQSARQGSVLVAPAGVAHGSRRLSHQARPGRTAWVLFAPAAGLPIHSWSRGAARVLAGRDVRPLWWALQGLHVEVNAARTRRKTSHATAGQRCDLVVATAQRLATAEADLDAPILEAWERVDAELARPWSATQLARLAGFSETHFRRQCRAVLGLSPGRHLTQLRMQRAAMLLTTTRDKLLAVAAAVGYTDEFAFSVAFKRWSGVAPSSYRQSP